MNIGQVVQALKAGKRAARRGWNGKNMWIALHTPELAAEVVDQPYVYMKTAQGTAIPWLCSQADLLADDWEILE